MQGGESRKMSPELEEVVVVGVGVERWMSLLLATTECGPGRPAILPVWNSVAKLGPRLGILFLHSGALAPTWTTIHPSPSFPLPRHSAQSLAVLHQTLGPRR